jgi:hypothetical protein
VKKKVGDKITTPFSDQPDKQSTIVEILPYRGKYPQWFNCVLVLTAPRTKKGTIEMAYENGEFDS